tara:strand:+ start:4090 stop:4947 length:858 start_codon:yes stop_codon:yes gene_type:complete
MRRKLININSIIFIVFIAIFTLVSYVSDQGVIRQEDNLRKSDIKIDNLTTKIYTVDTISDQCLALIDFSLETVIELNRKQLFWIKSLILLEKDSDYSDTKMINNIIDYEYTMKKIKKGFLSHFLDILVNTLEIVDRFELVHKWNDQYYKDYFDDQGYYKEEILNFDFENIFKDNLDFFNLKNFNYYVDDVDKFVDEATIDNYLDIYTFSHFLLKNMESFYEKINEDNIRFSKLSLEYSNLLDEELIVNKSISSLKNFLVLASIISQILSLFFLLLFFRNILIVTV